MLDFFARDYSGAPFKLFGGAHLVALALVAVTSGLVLFWGRTTSQPPRRRLRLLLAGLLIANEIIWHSWNVATDQWSVRTMLPLHLCSVLVWLCAYVLVSGDRRLYPFVYFLGIAGATQALLTPDAGPYGFPHYRFFQIVLSHGVIVLTGLWIAVVERFRPSPGDPVKVFVWLNLYALIVGTINWTTGANYLFIARKPATASLLDVLPDWPWYIAVLELLAVLLVAVLALPYLRG